MIMKTLTLYGVGAGNPLCIETNNKYLRSPPIAFVAVLTAVAGTY
jgi:hypothetical protein